MKTNPNDPANPVTADIIDYENLTDQIGSGRVNIQGLTKREQFAMAAMQGLCVGKISKDIMSGQCLDIANEAVEIADCLIASLNKEVPSE